MNHVPEFPSAVLNALSPNTKLEFANQLVAAGYDKTAVEARLNPSQQQVVHVPVNAQKAPITPETAQAVQALRQNWSGDKNQLEAELTRLGLADAKVTGPDPLAPPSDGQYRFHMDGHESLVDITEVAALHSELSTAFKSMELPSEMAQGLVTELFASADAIDGLNETQTAMFKAEQRAMLGKLGNADELMRLAAIAALKMPSATYQMLLENGAFETARSIATLANVGRTLEFRDKRKAS